MDDRLRQLERRGLAGDPEATEALLNAQRRMGMYDRSHYVIQLLYEMVAAGGNRGRHYQFEFNFELHCIVAVSSDAFDCTIEFLTEPNVFLPPDSVMLTADGMVPADGAPIGWANRTLLSDKPIHSINFSPQYNLFSPRFIPKGSSVRIEVNDLSLAANMVRIEFHGIRTVVKENE